MKRLLLLVLALSMGAPAFAAPKKLTLGVFLPTSLGDGEERFKFAEGLAQKLSTSLGQPVAAKNFARYEDFIAAAQKGQLDCAVVDGWVAMMTPSKLRPVAMGEVANQTHQRWAIVARQRKLVKDLAGQKLVIPKSTRQSEAHLVSNVVFQGDFDASKFSLVTVPNVESAVKLLETKSADAALVPAGSAPKDMPVVFRTQKLPSVIALSGNALFDTAFASLDAAPLSRFVAATDAEVTGLRRLLDKGPPARLCVMADSPVLPLDTAQVVDFGGVDRVLPKFTDFVEVSNEQADL